MSRIKKYLLTFLLLELFFSYTPAFAQAPPPVYSGPEAQITQYLCTPKTTPVSGSNTGTTTNGAFINNNSGVLYACINQLYKFAIIIAAVVGVFFIVIAGYIYMSAEGNAESSSKAKDILVTTITSLVILMAGYILLKALNPDLIQFHSIQPPSVDTSKLTQVGAPATGTPIGTGGGGVPAAGTSQQAAQNVLNLANSGKISLATAHASGNVDDANAAQNIKDQAAGKQAHNSCYTDGGITAPCKYVDLNVSMLNAIADAGGQMNVTVTELAGGVHSANMSDVHYTGRAVDIRPTAANADSQAQLVGILRKDGATQIGLECVGGPNNGFLVLTGTNDNNSACIGKSGYHIHASW